MLVTEHFPPAETIARWRSRAKGPLIVAILRHSVSAPVVNKEDVVYDNLICCLFDRKTFPLHQALCQAEHARTFEARYLPAPYIQATDPAKGKRVAVVGAGIVSLIAALEFARAGYAVEVFEKSPDPRALGDWRRMGCTHGGESVRMFSLTECDIYQDRNSDGQGRVNGFIDTGLERMGWGLGAESEFDAEDHQWKSEFRDVPIFLAEHYNEDVFDLNHESYRLWGAMMEATPNLFEGVDLTEGLLRICRTESYHDKQLRRQKHVRAFVRELDRECLIEAYPALATGCANDEIFGGIEVEGFTLNIQRFVRHVLTEAEALGVVFHWSSPVARIERQGSVIAGLVVAGTLRKSDHYFVSPGPYVHGLLDPTQSRGSVHGILGAWISVPNVAPKLQRSMKIAREGHIASCGNIIINEDDAGNERLVFGSGFGYLGQRPENIDHARLARLFHSMQDYVGQLFPEALEMARADGSLEAQRKYCIRPWTPTCLGIFEIQEAETGCLVVATGHNTGGFSQSTSVAKAALAAMRGDVHPMHSLYAPKRFRSFW
ncbi:FAD-binding oxidoreductase [Pelagibius sp. Alg239-R121]|uniref:NAD(P)/FAD-dependent oxidoreductase n=1 Tax=Pelagibius sp. Alg239-R121 TaxID=2993448 RepID=UPI0024A76AD7|nr:FAD-dependent oxidoreductase [Pelagibius sp. Alg239-R121]